MPSDAEEQVNSGRQPIGPPAKKSNPLLGYGRQAGAFKQKFALPPQEPLHLLGPYMTRQPQHAELHTGVGVGVTVGVGVFAHAATQAL